MALARLAGPVSAVTSSVRPPRPPAGARHCPSSVSYLPTECQDTDVCLVLSGCLLRERGKQVVTGAGPVGSSLGLAGRSPAVPASGRLPSLEAVFLLTETHPWDRGLKPHAFVCPADQRRVAGKPTPLAAGTRAVCSPSCGCRPSVTLLFPCW